MESLDIRRAREDGRGRWARCGCVLGFLTVRRAGGMLEADPSPGGVEWKAIAWVPIETARRTIERCGSARGRESMIELVVEGMSCEHCRAGVESALAKVAGVESVSVSLEEGKAKVEGRPAVDELLAAIEEEG